MSDADIITAKILTIVESIQIMLVKIVSSHWQYLVLSGLAIIMFILIFALKQRRKSDFFKTRLELADRILSRLSPEKGLEQNLTHLLDLLIPLVGAEGYYFYIRDQKKTGYVLKAVRHKSDGVDRIEPSYSGLAPYKNKVYNPPVGIPAEEHPVKIALIKDGGVSLLSVPVNGALGLIRIGPVLKVPKKSLAILEYLGERFKPALESVIEVEKMKNRLESVSASSDAIRSLTRSTMDLDGSLITVMGLSCRMAGSAGGVLLIDSGGHVNTLVAMGLEKEVEDMLRRDQVTQRVFFSLLGDKDVLVIKKDSREYYKLPSYLAAIGIESILVLKVAGRNTTGVVAFWYATVPVLEQHRMIALQVLAMRIAQTLDKQAKFKEVNDSYLDTLKVLVGTVDNLEPHTTGHSELISRYAGIIAREMGLGDRDIREITLGGYLHDLGMLGLSGDILFKDGKYNDFEYETMKLHADVGASIIESTIANQKVALYIRHHHERWDGYGYPSGLKGEDIPLGARIISVADMFNAKLTGRKYRDPASFEQAVRSVQSASGTQLDQNPVQHLLNWFKKKQSDPSRRGCSLGQCWEMRCCQPHIFKTCPAYMRTEVNCWDVPGVNCQAHGNKCATCLVHTEFQYRVGQVM